MTTFPQYAKTDHADVLEAVRATGRRRERFLTEMREMSMKLTGEPNKSYFRGWEFDNQRMTGIDCTNVDPEKLPGRWKQPRNGMISPYSSNPMAKEIDAITYRAVELPGRGNVLWGGDRMGTGTIFEHDGAVYSGLGFSAELPLAKAEAMAEYGWIEILASEFHKAMEDENARRAGDESTAAA